MLPFNSEFSDPCAKVRGGWDSNPSNEAGHISRNRDRFRVQHRFWKLPWQVVPKIGFANVVYVGLSVSAGPSAREFSSSDSRKSHTGHRQHAMMARHIIFVNMLLKMLLVLFQLAHSAKH